MAKRYTDEFRRDVVRNIQISRNPMYLVVAAVIAGVGVGLGTWVMLLILGLFIFQTTENQIKLEELA